MLPWDIIGHQKQLRQLEQDMKSGNLAHAYLLAGPEQIGKFTILKRFVHILQCPGSFCRHCSTCLEIARGCHADTIEVVDDGSSIKIETMRELLNKISMSAQSAYKIVLMKNIERMTPESANALLKTLEDPPPRVKFFFTTSNLASIVTTILSRVRLLHLQALNDEDLSAFLQQRYPHYPAHDLSLVAAFALGRVGRAVRLLENSDLFRDYQALYGEISALVETQDRVAQFNFAASLAKNDERIDDALAIFLLILRKKMLESGRSANRHDMSRWVKVLGQYQQLQEMRRRNVNERMLLENLMLAL